VLEFRILGPLEARDGDDSIPLGGLKQRAVLAILLLRANQLVSVDRLIDELWGEQPPSTATHSVEVYVSRLRKLLGGGGAPPIETLRPGYRLSIEAGQLDLLRFEHLLQEGRGALAAGDPVEASARLGEALGLWRGPPLADFVFEAFAQSAIGRLEELRLAAVEDRIDADLALGRHGELIAEVETMIGQHASRERLRGQLMLALYRAGRQGDALEAYRATRAALVEELGIEPSPALQRLERAILAQDEVLEWVPPTRAVHAERAPVREFERSILLIAHEDAEFEALLALAAPLARSQSPHELIVVQLLNEAKGRLLAEATARLQARRSALLDEGVAVRVAVCTSEEMGNDVVRLASQQDVDLLLLDARAERAKGPFGPQLAAVLEQAPCDVTLLVSGDPHAAAGFGAGAVVVPFGGAEHDWSAVELGAWLASGCDTELKLCGLAADRDLGRRDASRLLATASLIVQQLAGVIAEPVLTAPGVEGVLEATKDARVVVLGFSERWRSEGIGATRAAIVAGSRASCLLVRRGLRPGGLSPNVSLTRFTWSLSGERPGLDA
jgi:DNA-binding SARP family transcriptional activator